MTAEQLLRRYFNINREIDATLQRLEAVERRKQVLQAIDPDGEELHRMWVYIRQSETRIEHSAEELMKIESCIFDMIDALDAPQERQVLAYRYINGMSWRDIAEKMHYAEDTLFDWHKKALKHLKYPVKPS